MRSHVATVLGVGGGAHSVGDRPDTQRSEHVGYITGGASLTGEKHAIAEAEAKGGALAPAQSRDSVGLTARPQLDGQVAAATRNHVALARHAHDLLRMASEAAYGGAVDRRIERHAQPIIGAIAANTHKRPFSIARVGRQAIALHRHVPRQARAPQPAAPPRRHPRTAVKHTAPPPARATRATRAPVAVAVAVVVLALVALVALVRRLLVQVTTEPAAATLRQQQRLTSLGLERLRCIGRRQPLRVVV